MKYFIGMATLVVASLIAFAADPAPTLNPVPAGQFAEVTYPVTTGDQVTWKVSPAPRQKRVYLDSSDPTTLKSVLVFVGEAGGYEVSVTQVNFDKKLFVQKDVIVTLIGTSAPKLSATAPASTDGSVSPITSPPVYFYSYPYGYYTAPNCSTGTCPPSQGFYRPFP